MINKLLKFDFFCETWNYHQLIDDYLNYQQEEFRAPHPTGVWSIEIFLSEIM